MEYKLRDDIRQTNERIFYLLKMNVEPGDEDLEHLHQCKSHAIHLLNTTPWAVDMRRIQVAADFFHQVDMLNIWQRSKVTHALRCLQEYSREQLQRLAVDDEIMGNDMRLFPVSKRYQVRFSWEEKDIIKVHAIVTITNAGLLGYLEF